MGQLRRDYGYEPTMLLRETVGKFPDVYLEVDCDDGHPGLAVRKGAPALSDQLDRQKLVTLVTLAGANGVYQSTLHKASGFSSQHIAELLAELPGIECELKNSRPLYRRKSTEAEPVHEQEPGLEELESVRDRLLGLLGNSQRASHWLIDQYSFDHGTLLIVLAKYKDDFLVEEVNTGVSSYLMISAVAGVRLHPKPVLLGTPVSAEQPPGSAPQVNQPPELVDEVLGTEQAAQLRWRPPSRVMKDGRDRPRYPLIRL